jgi:hypothetical protein
MGCLLFHHHFMCFTVAAIIIITTIQTIRYFSVIPTLGWEGLESFEIAT